MKSGNKGYSVSSLMVVTFGFENFRSGERANLVNGLLNSSSTMPPGTEVTFQDSDMGEKV